MWSVLFYGPTSNDNILISIGTLRADARHFTIVKGVNKGDRQEMPK